MNIKNKILFITLMIFTLLQSLQSQSLQKFSGLIYFDYYYNISNKDLSKKDQNGFQFRRVFFTADFDVTNKLSTRIRLEPEYQGVQNNNKQFVFLKDMFFIYKLTNAQFLAGLMPTPNFEFEEKFWGYRSVERTQSDLRGWITIRDMGVLLRGKFNGEKFSYAVMFANNSFHGTETDKYKKFYFHLDNYLINNLYGSFDFNFANASDNKNVYYTKLGLYGTFSDLTGGLTFSNQLSLKSLPQNVNKYEYGLSVFGNLKIQDGLKTFLRFDLYEPNDKKRNDKEFTFITGLDYTLEKNLYIIPNISYNIYEDKNSEKDLFFRLTFHYQF